MQIGSKRSEKALRLLCCWVENQVATVAAIHVWFWTQERRTGMLRSAFGAARFADRTVQMQLMGDVIVVWFGHGLSGRSLGNRLIYDQGPVTPAVEANAVDAIILL